MEYPDSNIFTVKQFCKRHAWPTEGSLRWMINNANENGLAQCLIRIGSRVLIDEEKFFGWVEWQRRQGLRKKKKGTKKK